MSSNPHIPEQYERAGYHQGAFDDGAVEKVMDEEPKSDSNYLGGVILAHESLIGSVMAELIEAGIISKEGALEIISQLSSRQFPQSEPSEFVSGYNETLQKMETAIRRFQ